MKKAKLLPLLAAALLLASAPAQAAGRCEANGNGVQWKIVRRCPGAWGRFAFPDFLCPAAPAPGTDDAPEIPATPAPVVPDAPASDDGGAAPDVPQTPAPAVPDAAPTAVGLSAYEAEVVRLVNVERTKYGLSALSADAELSRGARAKSQDMRDKGYFSHESPTYGTPFQMMKAFGVSYRAAGENIAYGYATPEKVVDAWMNSEGHRANILNGSYTRLGVGYVADGHYWTQWFVG